MTGLVLNSIHKAFGGNTILDSLSLSFDPGTVTAIVGDNGAGKSTLMKTISGAVSLDGGSIALEGVSIHQLSSHKRREHGIEMVYQDLALAKQHDVVANLFLGRERNSYGFLKRSEMRRVAQEKLALLGIELNDLSVSVGNLSGGQQQAVAIARAAMFEPRVILFDEPTAALAAREVDRVLQLIKEQKRLGRIVILVSHRLNDVFAVADRIVVLKRGAVSEDIAAEQTSIAQIVEMIVR